MPASPPLTVRRIFIAPDTSHKSVAEYLPRLEQALAALRIETHSHNPIGQALPQSALRRRVESCDVVLVLGGDGYMMQTIRALEYPQVPFYGVNYGQVGFLMNPRMPAEDLVRLLLDAQLTSVSYPVLSAELELADGAQQRERAFNDFVLERASGQTVHLATYIDDVLLNRYSGDGLIVATPGGSSAYSLAAGGPLVHDVVESMIVTPLYPHRPVQFHSLQFPILLPLRSRIRVTVDEPHKRPARFVADGRSIESVIALQIAHEGLRVQLLRDPSYNFIEALVRKIIGRGAQPGGEE